VSTVEIVVPWRDSGNTLRLLNQTRVVDHLSSAAAVLPDHRFTVTVSDCDGAWSPGRARNAAAYRSTADILVFNDADSIVSYRALEEAVRLADKAPGLVLGYDVYTRLDAEQRVIREIANSGSMGCAAIQRKCFLELQGFDELFEGWGYEDLEFVKRAAARWPIRRVQAPLYHLYHGDRRDDDSPDDSDPVLVQENLSRWQLLTV
jgi:predicted glycosyltransferase involved in capsule biosynthesis